MTTSRPAATRDRRKLKLADEIEETALKLFAHRGFHTVTVDQVAQAADISTRTFFRYFATKEDVVLGGIVQRIDNVVLALAQRPAPEPPVTAIRLALAEVSGGTAEGRPRVDRWRAVIMAAEPVIAERGLRLLIRKHGEMTALVALRMGVDPGVDLRPGIVTAAMVGALRAGWHAGVANGRIDQLSILTAQALDLLAPALAPLLEDP
jgi:AcrR family transcriptional regulator